MILVVQVIEQVPPHLLPNVFAAVCHDRFKPKPAIQLFAPRPGPNKKPLTRLLQILPRTFHPAAVSVTCRDATDDAAIRIHVQTMPHCLKAPSAYDEEAYASMTFQLLAAVAPLAGGRLEDAWHKYGAMRIERVGDRLNIALEEDKDACLQTVVAQSLRNLGMVLDTPNPQLS